MKSLKKLSSFPSPDGRVVGMGLAAAAADPEISRSARPGCDSAGRETGWRVER